VIDSGSAEALDHRIGIGERAEQQSEQRVDHQEGQESRAAIDPRAGQDIAALGRHALPAPRFCSSVAIPFKSASLDDVFFLLSHAYSTRLVGSLQYFIGLKGPICR